MRVLGIREAPLGAVGLIVASELLLAFGGAGTGVVLPDIQETFGLELTGITAVATVSALAATVLGLPVSSWIDLRARRVTWVAVGALLAGLSGAGGALAPTAALFALASFTDGFALGVTGPVRSSVLADYSPVGDRPAVYAATSAARAAGVMLGPVAVGGVAVLAGWRWALLVTSALAVAVGLASLRLREPERGAQERRALGLDGVAAEARPRLAEAVALCRSVRTVRRLWWSTPFTVGAMAALGLFMPLYLQQNFGLNAAERGLAGALAQPFAIAGLLLGAPLARRLLDDRPERLFRLVSLLGFASGGCVALMALAPSLWSLLAASCLLALAGSLLGPGISTVLSLVMPARARTVGFAIAALWSLPGVLLLPVMGAIGQAWGYRAGLVTLAPIMVAGALVLGTSGGRFREDLRDARLLSSALSGSFLALRGVSVDYGKERVLRGVDLDVAQGELVALLGTNGAGKTTLLGAVCGAVPTSGGGVVFAGRDIGALPAAERAALGVALAPGGTGVLGSLTVAENLRLAAWAHRRDGAARVAAALELLPELRPKLGARAATLSGGQQRMLTLAQALVARPRLLLVDELSLGLAPAVVERLLAVIRRLHREGTTVVVVEQSVNLALDLCPRAVFMERGEIRYDGPAAGLRDRADLLRPIFLTAGTAPAARDPGPPVLRVDGLTRRFGGITAVDEVSFTLRRGEVLGLIGPNGAGKTTVLDLLSGLVTPDSGRIGRDAALGRCFQSAGQFPALTVMEAVMAGGDRHLAVREPLAHLLGLRAARLSERAARASAAELIELLNLGDHRDHRLGELSTGTRRVVDLACALAHRPGVLLLDEPSSGLAQREVEHLAALLLRVRDELDAGLLVVEHDIPLLASLATRLVALDAGRVVAAGPTARVLADPAVVAGYLGGDPRAVQRSGRRDA